MDRYFAATEKELFWDPRVISITILATTLVTHPFVPTQAQVGRGLLSHREDPMCVVSASGLLVSAA